MEKVGRRLSVCEREVQGEEPGCVTVAEKVDESDSVGTSGRKGTENAVAFPSRMGTLGPQRSCVGSGMLCKGLARKEAV